MKTKRTYTMGARAEAVAQTRRRIMAATVELAQTQLIATISLDAVAERAGVSVQTVLRQFGSRAGLIEATVSFATEMVTDERSAPVGDIGEAVRVIVDHYEARGDGSLLLLAQESDPDAAAVLTHTRLLHETWVRNVFAPMLAAADDPDELFDLLLTATDVYTWKLLRRDRQLSRAATEQRMNRLVRAVLTSAET
ncbi:TetR/AcrR family transcriptional regulator [Gordonia sp. NPDC003424]